MNADLPVMPSGGPVPAADLETEIQNADLIVAATVTWVRDASGPVSLVSTQARLTDDQLREAEVAVIRTLAGRHRDGPLHVFFLIGKAPSRPWMELAEGETVLLVLRSTNGAYVPQAPARHLIHTLSDIAPPPAGASRRKALAHELEQILLAADPDSELNVIMEASQARAGLLENIDLRLLDTPALQIPARRAAWVFVALARGQAGALGELSMLFAHLPPPPADVLWSLMAQKVSELRAPVAYSQLAALVRSTSPELARAAAMALRQLHERAAIPSLISALNHPDQQVRYQAVMGLAELEPGVGLGPSFDLYRINEPDYIERWKQWWASSGHGRAR